MIKSLTSLRGIFVLFVFFHHCLNLYPGGGSMAVAFFFVFGGFCMTLGYKDKVLMPEFKYNNYLLRRCIKFYPLHWLCLLAILPYALRTFSLGQVPILFVNAALLHSWVPIKDVYFSFNAVSWYLADTLFFAVLFPMIFMIIVQAKSFQRILFAVLIAAAYALVVLLLPTEKYHAILYISPYIRLTDFVFGIYLALAYLHLSHSPAKWWNGNVSGVVIVFALIALLVVESCLLSENARMIAPLYWPIVAAIILTASLVGRSGRGRTDNLLENKILYRLGELSFIIFMIHPIVLRYAKLVRDKISLENDFVYVCCSLVLTILLSHVVETLFLKPVTQWITKRTQRSLTAQS